MTFLRFFALILLISITPAWAETLGTPRLEIVAQLKQRPGNIAVASNGRMFISIHPFDNPVFKVMELAPDGTTKPYPSEEWSREPGDNGVGLANVIHLLARGDTLYIMDMGSARIEPKLVAWDIAKNKLKHIWYMPRHVVTPQSFMQDFVMTPDENHVFIADMGQADLAGKADPAIVHVNLETGEAERLLAGHTSVRPGTRPMMAAGQKMMFSREGKENELYLGLNPITMDPHGVWVYYAGMGQGLAYRIKVKDLLDPALSAKDRTARIETVGAKPPSDGMIIDGLENLFITSVNDGSIGVLNNKGKYSTWLRDPLLLWPDGLAFGPDNALYATINQLNLAAPFNKGEEKSEPPYMVIRIVGGRPVEKKE